MRQEHFGGETVYRVYERERLRRMARKLGLRLVKFSGGSKKAEEASGGRSRREPAPVVAINAPKRAV